MRQECSGPTTAGTFKALAAAGDGVQQPAAPQNAAPAEAPPAPKNAAAAAPAAPARGCAVGAAVVAALCVLLR